jgi:biotin carboxyl carrier protein
VSPVHVRLAVTIDGTERTVDIDDGAVRVDGKAVDVEVRQAEPGVFILRRGSEQTVVQVDGNGNGNGTNRKLAVEIKRPGRDAVVITAVVGDARRAAIATPGRSAAGAAPATVRSPIPGRLIKLLVKVGDPVAAGQTLVVLEAMKMENELGAPRAGRIADVRCAEGTAVEAGQDLIVVA